MKFVVTGALLGAPTTVGCGADDEPEPNMPVEIHERVNEPAEISDPEVTPPAEDPEITVNEPPEGDAPEAPAPAEDPEPTAEDRPHPNAPAHPNPPPVDPNDPLKR